MELTKEGIEHRYTLRNRPVVGDRLDAAPDLGPGHAMEVSRPDMEPTQQVSAPPKLGIVLVNTYNLLYHFPIIIAVILVLY